jgi:hypothetical protein
MIDLLQHAFMPCPRGSADSEGTELMGKETGKVKIIRFGKFEAENIWVCPDKLIETLKVVSWPEVIFTNSVSHLPSH